MIHLSIALIPLPPRKLIIHHKRAIPGPTGRNHGVGPTIFGVANIKSRIQQTLGFHRPLSTIGHRIAPRGPAFLPAEVEAKGFYSLPPSPPSPATMLPYRTLEEAEAALGRNLTTAESLWLRYSADMPDPLLYYHNTLFLLIIFTLAPLPLALIELGLPSAIAPFKLQPGVRLPSGSFFKCYASVMRVFVLVVGPLQLVSYPTVKMVGIRTGLPLPSGWEMAAQLLVYFLIEDYGNYWIHRLLHCRWGYEKIHRIHHEFTAPFGFAAPYAHWAEVLILGIPSFVGPALAPCHMVTFWLWIALRQIEAIDTHSGYDFPQSPTKYIPFYGGAEYHDYHHYVGGQSQSNFASVFTYCDYIYGTDKGYRYQKANLAKLREKWARDKQNGKEDILNHNEKSE